MPKSKLSWEWGPHDDEIIIRKAKGKLTMDEMWNYLCSHEIVSALGENALATIVFRIRELEYPGWDFAESEGDAQSVYILADGAKCICGRTELYRQYCPKCGEKLVQEVEK